jgi:hypothetical protein
MPPTGKPVIQLFTGNARKDTFSLSNPEFILFLAPIFKDDSMQVFTLPFRRLYFWSNLWSSVVAKRKSEWRQMEVMLVASSLSFRYNRNLNTIPVLRIRDVYPGSRIRNLSIPDPGPIRFRIPDPDPHQRF